MARNIPRLGDYVPPAVIVTDCTEAGKRVAEGERRHLYKPAPVTAVYAVQVGRHTATLWHPGIDEAGALEHGEQLADMFAAQAKRRRYKARGCTPQSTKTGGNVTRCGLEAADKSARVHLVGFNRYPGPATRDKMERDLIEYARQLGHKRGELPADVSEWRCFGGTWDGETGIGHVLFEEPPTTTTGTPHRVTVRVQYLNWVPAPYTEEILPLDELEAAA